MHNLQKQQGMATILLVFLIGISVMLLTATIAKTLVSKKEASVAAHAQTNAQVMGWAGVSAFREYLLKQGQDNLSNIRALAGVTITLRSEANQKEVLAKNIQVIGCNSTGATCQVTAEISSDHLASKAATTIEVTYDLSVGDGTIAIAGQTSALNFTGNTFMSGTNIEAEVPNSKVTMNIDGNMALQAGFKTKNVSSLIINSTGNVDIDCSFTRCGGTKITVNARGYVHIVNPGEFGNINAIRDVKLTTGVNADHITSLSTVDLTTNSTAKSIRANGRVFLTNASAEEIYSNADVRLTTGSQANQISTQASIHLSLSRVIGNVEAAKNINISASTVQGYAKAHGYVDLDTNTKVDGNVYAKGEETVGIYNAAVRVSTSRIGGNVYAKGNVSLPDGATGIDIQGSTHITGEIKLLKSAAKGAKNENLALSSIPELTFTIPQIVDPITIRQHIEDQFHFNTKVDVRVYKQDANYIFTRSNEIAKVYLNHLRNEQTGITYLYENGQQYQVNANGNKSLINNMGFFIGKYSMEGKEYVGAICESVDRLNTDVASGRCSSTIIGYLPRLSVESTFDSGLLNIYGVPEAYSFSKPLTWYVRSLHDTSSITNANLAPGILYFEGKLIISGHPNLNADSSTNTYTNSFLAEESIDIVDSSPRIYSPYNTRREVPASAICSRKLATVKNIEFTNSTPVTTTATLSNQFLTPVNLCKNNTEFAYTMNLDPVTALPANVSIDGTSVRKLDLGYVAVMSNKIVRVGACSQIFGDVYARSNIESSKACGINSDRNGIIGNISTQGEAPVIDGIQHHNTFGAGSRIVVPHSDYSNAKDIDPSTSTSGSQVSNITVYWSKYK